MRKFPYKTWLLAGVLLLTPWAAQAAGLGRLTILSALGQPLSAEVELISVQRDELSTLSARLASPDAFTQAGVQYSPALSGARVSIEKRADGRPYIRITSPRPLNEPFIDLLIELSWAQGRLVREYTALIDPPADIAPPVATVVPPSVAQAQPVTPVAPAPGVAVPPVETRPSAKPPSAARTAPARASATAPSGEYGPVKRGETLARIATSVKPEGVTLEQMLVSLYRTNPDAFVGNMNRLKTGRILRVPEREQITETAQPEALKEVRVQAANWNAYRQKLAAGASETMAQESKSAARGKIATTVDDKAAGKEPPKEVLKLSKGDTTAATSTKRGGKPMSAQERARMLEEEVTARVKALAEATDRIAQLEKTIKDMQRLLEIKGQVPGKPAAPPVTASPPAAVPPATVSPPPATVSPPSAVAPAPPPSAKPEPAPAPGPIAGAPRTDQVIKPDAAPVVPPTPSPTEPLKDAAKAPAEAIKPEPAKPADVPPPPVAEKPKAKAPKIVQPPPQPDLVDQIMSEPLYLAGGAALLALLGIGGYLAARRRAEPDADDEASKALRTSPNLGKVAPTIAPAAVAPATVTAADDVDPLAEADLYLNFGRDAQAEEVLKEALQKKPTNVEAQLKLLQIYAARKDKDSFERVAKTLHAQTHGTGDIWMKAAAMGFALDAANSLYEAGRSAPVAPTPMAGGAAAGTDLDFDFDLAPTEAAAKTDVEFDVGGAHEKTLIMQPGVLADMAAAPDRAAQTVDITSDSGMARASAEAASAPPDFSLDLPPDSHLSAEPDITLDSTPGDVEKTHVTADSGTPMANVIDFNFEAAPAARPPESGKGFTHDGTVIMSPENQDKAADLSMDFELVDTAATTQEREARADDTTTAAAPVAPGFTLDLPSDTAATTTAPIKFDDIDLSLDDPNKTHVMPAAEGGAKDDHWYDVQTKFDLAKAYQEMGDKDGAREILQEVMKEGDAGQHEEAKKLLEALG